MFVNDAKNTPVNVVVLSDVNNNIFREAIVDSSIKVSTIAENEKQTVDSSIEETPVHSPLKNNKTRSFREIYG